MKLSVNGICCSLKKKKRFTSRNFKLKKTLKCTDGTTLPQYGIHNKQNTGTQLNKSISSANNLTSYQKTLSTALMTMNISCITSLYGAAINLISLRLGFRRNFLSVSSS